MNDCTTLIDSQLTKALSEEDVLKADLGEEQAAQAMAILDEMSCSSKTVEHIASKVMGRKGRTALQTFYRWRMRSQVLCRLYARAREARADVIADEIIHIVDTEKDPQKARARMDARKWYAGKCNRGLYGDDPVTVNGTVQHEHTHTGGRELLDALAKVVAKRRALIEGRQDDGDGANVVDAVAVEVTEKREPSSTPGGPANRASKAGVSAPPPPPLASRTKPPRRKSQA